MFDSAEIMVRAGNGGSGVVTFRREKFAPLGGPDGGDGGAGGDVVMTADDSVDSLRLFKRNRLYRAGDGGAGRGQKRKGKRGNDLILKVPVGTVVWEETTKGTRTILADLSSNKQEEVVARGGSGGKGNTRYATSTNQAPRIAQTGEDGEEKLLALELRLIADVGIIGFPNVGKSSLLAAASKARPKIADYPFTTLEPILGVVELSRSSFVLAEIPGLIEGAHTGRGLGSEFLRHALRTKVLIHLIDGSSISPMEDMVQVNTELRLFDGGLAAKPQVIAVNKIDLPDVREKVTVIRDLFTEAGTQVFFVSAATGEGVVALMEQAAMILHELTSVESAKTTPMIFRPAPHRPAAAVRREGETFFVDSRAIERIMVRVDMTDSVVRNQLRGQMDRMGISRALEKAGIKPGDTVRFGSIEWVW